MRELIQIESPTEHSCSQPSMDRWQVLEPISGRWSWMTVFSCCEHVSIEHIVDENELKSQSKIKRAA